MSAFFASRHDREFGRTAAEIDRRIGVRGNGKMSRNAHGPVNLLRHLDRRSQQPVEPAEIEGDEIGRGDLDERREARCAVEQNGQVSRGKQRGKHRRYRRVSNDAFAP